jgi:sugar phosphate permease
VEAAFFVSPGHVVIIGTTLTAQQPGALYMLSMWYTRKELALRMSLFYCGSISSNGWGSLIAAGILSRFHDWRMLFYIEGGITMAIGIAAIWILPGMPATARWL